jgi:hypothetical protein
MDEEAKEKDKEKKVEISAEKGQVTSVDTKKAPDKTALNNTQSDIEKVIADRVEEVIKKTREDEKKKLYDTLEKLKSDLNERSSFIDQLKIEKDRALEEEKKKRDAAMSETEKLQLQITQLTEKLDLIGNEHIKTRTELEDRIRKKELDLLKKDIIVEHRGSIVESLIRGDSEEELLQSLETAKQEYSSIVESVKNQQKDNLQTVAKNNAPKPTSNQNIIQQSSNDKDISSLNREDLEKRKREEVSKYLNSLKK